MNNNFNNILELYGRVVYSHKTHERAIERLNKKIKTIKIIQIFLLSLTSAGVISSLSDVFSPIITTHPNFSIYFNLGIIGLALVATGFSIYDLCSSDREDLYSHKVSASQFLFMRDKYLMLITDYKDQIINDQQLLECRDKLFLQLSKIYEESPSTTSKDYIEARKALKDNEEYTFNAGEVEKFLPVYMRSNQ
ncbi:SLATT domain-containing protein [Cytobacillus solani]|uniref:SLATT domain-containing protein n=1 Tax=Cytobacillus solani TaxID=1637975 RepID=UPI00115042DA|nr:SLATT domain-containing protein [Cytobacillus solani]